VFHNNISLIGQATRGLYSHMWPACLTHPSFTHPWIPALDNQILLTSPRRQAVYPDSS